MESANYTFPSIADKTILINGILIAYKDEGEGQILLCLHAVGHSSKDFAALYSLDLKKFRIISLDFPGHGKSAAAAQDISATYFSTVVLHFIKALHLKNVIIIGNSIGGATALRVAAYNSNIRMLSLSNPGGLDKGGLLAPFFLNYMIRFFQQGVKGKPGFKSRFEKMYKRILITPVAADRRKDIVQDAYLLAPLLVQAWTSFKSKDEDVRPLIKTINCPVLFTWGIKDKFVRLSRNINAIKQFKHYQLVKYDIGHTPYVECPDRYKKDWQDFVNLNL